ncbi:MAG: OmpA family protein [Alphaproteobacteria bacterium]|nr:OmpA family protein [Alphaproteobacteria bacterium]
MVKGLAVALLVSMFGLTRAEETAPEPPAAAAETAAPAEAAPAEAAPAEAAVPADPAKPPRSFVIFFHHAGPWIPEEAQAVIPQVAEVFLRVGYSAIKIGCYSDNVGSQDLNLALTKDRASRIETDLVRYKVPEAAITAEGFGFADPLVDGMPLDTTVSNRRCLIDLR